MSSRLTPLLLALAACGGAYKAPPAVDRIDLPKGDALKPYDSSKPGRARPQVMAELGGTVYVTLSNLRQDYSIGGPGLLAAFVPSSGAVTLLDLGGQGGKQCQSPAFVRAAGSKLYATCGGDFVAETGRAVLEIDPSGAISHALAPPTSPSGVAVAPSRIWFGDNVANQVWAIDSTAWKLIEPPIVLPCDGKFPYVPDVALIDGDLYAICSSSTDGVLYRLDATTGTVRAQVVVGPIAQELAATEDGRIAVASAGYNAVQLVSTSAGTLSVTGQVKFSSANEGLQDVRARGRYLYTVQSLNNTVQKIDLMAQGGPKVVAESNLGTGSNPWNILPLDDDQAIVSNNLSDSIVAVRWSATR